MNGKFIIDLKKLELVQNHYSKYESLGHLAIVRISQTRDTLIFV